MVKRSPQEFQRQTRLSSADADAVEEADSLEALDAVVAVVDGAGVLLSELEELDD